MAESKFKHIVSVYGTCSEAGAVVMEHMSNGSLNSLLASHTLMWPKKVQMLHEISMGMNFLHSMTPTILHLNLKTSNVLLDDHLHAKVSRGHHTSVWRGAWRMFSLTLTLRFQILLWSAGKRAWARHYSWRTWQLAGTSATFLRRRSYRALIHQELPLMFTGDTSGTFFFFTGNCLVLLCKYIL